LAAGKGKPMRSQRARFRRLDYGRWNQESGAMKIKTGSPTEAEKFDTVVRKLLSVSHEEIQKRDKEWRRKRNLVKKKRAT
jgi:hypothetical protein